MAHNYNNIVVYLLWSKK